MILRIGERKRDEGHGLPVIGVSRGERIQQKDGVCGGGCVACAGARQETGVESDWLWQGTAGVQSYCVLVLLLNE